MRLLIYPRLYQISSIFLDILNITLMTGTTLRKTGLTVFKIRHIKKKIIHANWLSDTLISHIQKGHNQL